MDKKVFDPDKIIDYTKDYYGILELEKGCLPEGITRDERKQISNILEKAWRKQAIATHPDKMIGEDGKKNDAPFRLAVQAHTILSDPILRKCYESGGKDRIKTINDGTDDLDIDWSNIGSYRQGTLADTTGYEIYLQISERCENLQLIPAFCPKSEEDAYEWDWVIKDKNSKLTLSIVNDENEVGRIAGNEDIEKALPFKIFICIPRAFLYFARGSEERFEHEDGTVDILSGKLQAASYSDYNLLETTVLETAYDYIKEGGKLEEDLKSYRDGKLVEEQAQIDAISNQANWVDTERIKQLDAETLRNILKMKTYKTSFNEHAADFLKDI